MQKLKVKIGKLELNNPIMPASGTFGYGKEFARFFDINNLGAIVTKGLSLYPKTGNIPPRIYEGGKYLMNAIGLENIGFERFLEEIIPFYENLNCAIIVNCFGNSEDEYYILAEKLNNLQEIDALEVNVSCPNVKKGAIEFGTDLDMLYILTKNIKKIADKKSVIVKISPMLSNIAETGKVLEEAGADAITAVNTMKGIAINTDNFKYMLGNVTGGISGQCLKPVALRIVKELIENISIPVIGVGGIFNINDAVEFFAMGATAVQIGTANFINPMIMIDLIDKLSKFMDSSNIKSVNEIKNKI